MYNALVRIEIHDLAAFDRYLEAHQTLAGIVVQGVDLQARTDEICASDIGGAVFLGCPLSDVARHHVLQRGGLLFPRLPKCPYRAYRGALYSVEELIEGYRPGDPASWSESTDQVIYRHVDAIRRAEGPTPILEALSQRLHDHAIDNALDELLHEVPRPRVVAIMGGHAIQRTDDAYRRVARTAQLLSAKEYLMASGGGPGAMEATHLGAWLAHYGEAELDAAIDILARAPGYQHEGWLDTALEVRDAFPQPVSSLGIPTWFYGHEPPNLFATHIAKYFSNSLREDGLLAIATHGVIYSPGSAGTIQEIFMDAAQNHYGTFGEVSPMVFLDRAYWTETKPIYPLVRQLASGHQYASLLGAEDDPERIVAFIEEHPPTRYER